MTKNDKTTTSKLQPVIELKNISKIYGTGGGVETLAVDKINLSIHKGDFIAIMGSSGSGKSSLMHIIGLLDRKYKGNYKLNGYDISKMSDNATSDIRGKEIGFVFQQFNLLKRSTVLENVMLPTTYNASPGDELKAIEMIKKVGLEERIHNRSNQLSGGQIQRVAIARALMMNPTILLADEPTGNLDSKTAHEVMEIFKSINRSGTTIVLITHEEDIAQYAKQIIKLKDGHIISRSHADTNLGSSLKNSKKDSVRKGGK